MFVLLYDIVCFKYLLITIQFSKFCQLHSLVYVHVLLYCIKIVVAYILIGYTVHAYPNGGEDSFIFHLLSIISSSPFSTCITNYSICLLLSWGQRCYAVYMLYAEGQYMYPICETIDHITAFAVFNVIHF